MREKSGSRFGFGFALAIERTAVSSSTNAPKILFSVSVMAYRYRTEGIQPIALWSVPTRRGFCAAGLVPPPGDESLGEKAVTSHRTPHYFPNNQTPFACTFRR